MRSKVLALLLPIAVFSSAWSQAKPEATLIVTHAKVWTVDPSRPEAEAIAVLGDRIVAVGSDAEAMTWRGPQTKLIDAGGKRVLPGFNDAHVHFIDGGEQLDEVQLNDATSSAEFVRRIAEKAHSLSPGQWLRGGNWDETKWSPPDLPTRQLIDPVTAGIPVYINRYDGHMSLANSLALKMAGITAHTPDPPGGVIVRDARGEPTGALKDAAEDLMLKVIPVPTPEQLLARAKRALDYAASLGVTSVQHMNPTFAEVAAYSALAERGDLTTRIYAAPLITQVDDVAKIGIRHAFGTPYLRIGALKAYADGSLGSRTAYLFAPYSDEAGNRGLLSEEMQPLSKMRDRMLTADSAGLQLCTHAIGDRAISTVLDLYSEIQKAHGASDRRWRIEHAQHMAAKDFDRFAQLGVIASVQPTQAIDDGRWAEARIGHDRASRTYAFRTFLNDHVRLAFGTDWPIVSLDPLLGIYAAVTRAPLDGKLPNGWFPDQKLTVAEAVDAYTMGSAYAEFQNTVKGSITPGKLADMVVLSDDIFSMNPTGIRNVKVVQTIFGGKVIYGK